MKKASVIIIGVGIIGAIATIAYLLLKKKKPAAASASDSTTTTISTTSQMGAGSTTPGNATATTQAATVPSTTPQATTVINPVTDTIASNTPAITNPKARIYQDINYGWYVGDLAVGYYPNSDALKANGISNDAISSIQLDPGIKVILYQDKDRGGGKLELTKSVSNMKDYGFNDLATSIDVIRA